MNRDKLIAILLFLLLLLIIICTWFHGDNIVKNRALTANTPAPIVNHSHPSQPINFHLTKDKDQLELNGNFSKKESIEKLRASLGQNNLSDLSKVDAQLTQEPDAILLVQQLIPIFKDKYISGSIDYHNNKITVEGVVNSRADKDSINTLLANATLPSINNTKIIQLPKKPIMFKIDKQNNLLALQGLFGSSTDIEKLINALDDNDLKKRIEVDKNLQPSQEILSLTVQLIQPFKELYSEGFIQYENKILTLEGIVLNEEAKNKMESLLEKSAFTYVNNTQVIKQKSSVDEATQEQAQKEVIEIEAEIKQIIDLENINFEVDKARLTEKSLNTIKHIATILKDHPSVNVEIAGHTDNTGDDTYNLSLSQSRVDTVKKQLIEMGIDASRLKAIGYGETQALVSNDTEENRRLNRRVEFKIIGE